MVISSSRSTRPQRRISAVLFGFVLSICPSLIIAAPFFEDTVAPILKARCAECHNERSRKGELDLSSTAGILKGGESGPVFKAGDPEHSHLFEMVHRGEMPKKGGPLSGAQLDAIREWIDAGAAFREEPALTKTVPNQHDVIPVMLLRCTACHGPQQQDGGLDLRTPASMRKGGNNGPALVEGKPDDSLLIQRIESEACPPQDLLLKFFVKRPPASEVATLRDWIAAGAPEDEIGPDVASTEPDPLVSDEERRHWAFVRLSRSSRSERGETSVDQFIGEKLTASGLDFSPEADRDTLIRRAWIDLTGMPPSPEEWRYWSESRETNWYASMIEELLASPHYGERWGRYWLDLSGYADSEGGLESDPLREVAWKYRDYVVNAFNRDKPYNRFLLEQIAGDELIDHERSSEISEEMVENLIATGFLRMGVDQTGSRTMNFTEDRLGVIYDAIGVLGSGVMGLTMNCARCHSHKYDPIPQRDYFRLKAVFQGAFDEYDWLSFKDRKLEAGTSEHRQRIAATNPAIEKELESLEAEWKRADAEMRMEMMRSHYPGISGEDQKATLVALKKAANVRTLTQAILVEKFLTADLVPDEEQPEAVLSARRKVADLERRMETVRSGLEAPLAIRALWDRGDPSPTYMLRRGEHDKPGRLVGPGVPAVLTDGKSPFPVTPPFPDGTPKTGRRLAFARWLTEPDHPLTARVMVNRIWHHHFGSGIVRTLENFGAQGARPTHPELLDWLALEFVERGWSVKEMHRLIMNSRAYRQSSRITAEHVEHDPDNRLFSRMNLRRMDAEVVNDSLLFVSGKLEDRPGGPPDGVTVGRGGLVTVNATPSGGWRRSLYSLHRRTEMPTMLETFDYPEMGPNCVERSVSTVSPQALMLLNNGRVHELARALAKRVMTLAGEEPGDQVEAVYHLALSRSPGREESRLGVKALRELRDEWEKEPDRALETYCHTILNSAAFLYID